MLVAFFFVSPRGWSQELGEKERKALLQAYQRIRDGIPAEGNIEKIRARGEAAIDSLSNLQTELKKENRRQTGKCQRFIEISQRLSVELQGLVGNYRIVDPRLSSLTNADFEIRNRTMIAITAFAEMEFLIQNQAEAGYSVLDFLHDRTTCPFASREALAASYTKSTKDLTQFFETAFGSPGLTEMLDTQDRLLTLAIQDDRADKKRFWALMAGLTVTSVVFWEFGPALAASSVRIIFGYTPRILAVPAFVYGISVSALVAENVAYNFADEASSYRISPSRMIIGSWEEHMDSIDYFLKSPVHAPELELFLLSRVQSVVFAEALSWMKQFKSLIEREEAKR